MMKPIEIKTLLTTPEEVFGYALDVLKAPFPAGEEAIAENAEYSYRYAFYVLKAPFPAAEAAIAENAGWAYCYACAVLKHLDPDNWAKEFKAKAKDGE
jgi:hypothetical protein